MSEGKIINTNSALYRRMSIPQLEQLLRQDALCADPEDGELSPDELMCIISALTEKREQAGCDFFPDADDSLEAFKENYGEMAEGPDAVEPVTVKKRRPAFRTLIAVAAAALLVLGGAVTSSALGFDLWRGLAGWTEDHFVIGEKRHGEENAPPLDELRATLELNGLDTAILPGYIPEGYSSESMDVKSDERTDEYMCHLTDGQGELVLCYKVNLDGSPAVITEKDEVEHDVRSIGGVEYCYVNGDGTTGVMWTHGAILCSVTYTDPGLDIDRIVSSIGK